MQLRDAAETLGVHYQTAYGWVRQGTLRARKTPRGYEVSESDVRDLLTRRAAGAEPPREVQVRDWAAQADRLYAALVAVSLLGCILTYGLDLTERWAIPWRRK